MSYTYRLIEAYQKILQGDLINALIQISINLDITAKKTYGGKSGERIKRYIREHQYILTRIATLHLEVHGDMAFQVSGDKYMKFEEVVYKLVRCALLHEGELDPRIKIVDSPSIGVDENGVFLLSKLMVYALFLLLISDPKNKTINWPNTASFTIDDKKIKFSDVQGNVQKLVDTFRSISKEKSNIDLEKDAR
ncbi:MAG: hypothetical protein HY882_00675 [Deltaproteobacteria bacterium]|nr:hypothetical protein [Deltaproteobacteria bacterium]